MHPLIKLAKQAVESYIKQREIISVPNNFPKEFLNKRNGVFVTIKKSGELRGCIGTYLPTRKNIAEETIYNAIAAATQDWRFGPVQPSELPFLSYEIYILFKPNLVKNLNELNPLKYGIIVKSANFPGKSGLLLPGLEGIDSVNQQIDIACRKAGIDPENEEILVYKFEAEKYE